MLPFVYHQVFQSQPHQDAVLAQTTVLCMNGRVACRLDVDRFVLSASQKKVLRQFRNKINAEACHAAPADAKDELLRLLHIDGEAGNRLQVGCWLPWTRAWGLAIKQELIHGLWRCLTQVTVERAAFDDEGFGLYQRYQIAVHKV